MASCPDPDNSWVLAGSESLPVETLGPESSADAESEQACQALGSPSEAAAGDVAGGETEAVSQSESPQSGPILLEKTAAEGDLEGHGCAGGPLGPRETPVQGDSDEALGLGVDTEDLEGRSPSGSLSSSSNAAWPGDGARGSSSEDDTDGDVEGLRRRRGREPRAAQPEGPLRVEDQAGGEGAGWELGVSPNVCILGALVLLGLGILLFSGALLESDSGPAEEVDLQVFPDTGLDTEVRAAARDEQDGAPGPSDGVPSLQSMALLLDRLAKENQDVGLLQARLQAQKEELQSLLLQPRELEEENARLRGALRQGEAAQRALESELQQLRARLRGLEADCVRGPDGGCLSRGPGSPRAGAAEERGPRAQGWLEAEAQALRRELERQRELLGSVRRDLEQSLRAAGRGDPARAGLSELGRRLARELQDLEEWGRHPGARANASEPRFRSSPEGSGKEKGDGRGDRGAQPRQHEKEGRGPEGKQSWQGEDDRGPAGRGSERGGKKGGRRQGPREPPRRSGSPHPAAEGQEHPQWKAGTKGRRDPLPPWAELSRHKYRVPQGCSGVQDCARQEGLAFGVELAPVQQQELASLLRTYLARLPWAGQLTEQLPLSPAYFREDGVFRHDRLRFRDFVDALEDSLEEVAVRHTGDDDEVDDFESFIFSHFFGDKALKKRSGKKDRPLRRG